MNKIEFKVAGQVTADQIDGEIFNRELYSDDLNHLEYCTVPGKGTMRAGENGVTLLAINKAHEFIFVGRGNDMEVVVNNKAGIFPSFALLPTQICSPIKGVLFDLDGTCVKSEAFWIETILETTNRMRDRYTLPHIERFAQNELPHISGRTVPEHLMYCIQHYFPEASLLETQTLYTEIAEEYMLKLNSGELDIDAFEPVHGLKELLIMLKTNGIKIGIVTSGLHYKAWPELEQAMNKMGMEDAREFFDAILTSGTLAKRGVCGTMGNAIAKPWPNIYFEAAQVIGFTMQERCHYVGVGDSNSDAGSLRFMGTPFIGVAHGNIEEGGTKCMCTAFAQSLDEVTNILKKHIK